MIRSCRSECICKIVGLVVPAPHDLTQRHLAHVGRASAATAAGRSPTPMRDVGRSGRKRRSSMWLRASRIVGYGRLPRVSQCADKPQRELGGIYNRATEAWHQVIRQ
jgi:hypothetical protein